MKALLYLLAGGATFWLVEVSFKLLSTRSTTNNVEGLALLILTIIGFVTLLKHKK